MTEIAVAFIIAVIVGMGIGGGGFFVIYLTLCLGYNQIIAQGTNLLFFLISALASLAVHARRRRLFLAELIPIILISLPSTVIGANLANSVDPKIPTVFLGVLLTFSGVLSAIKTVRSFVEEKKAKKDARN